MRIIARKNIVAYFTTHPLTRASLTHWLEVAENADWSSTSEVMADFSKAKTVTAERVRFEVAGGDHRMIVAFHFRRGMTASTPRPSISFEGQANGYQTYQER